ncbi:MAG TPA: hypothetical protein VFO52_10155 [Longimicrobiales bacterium]|nr:hypothetical protein [Longimicrobiales bacterium]
MTKSYQRMLFCALLALTPLFSACERADDVSSVTVDPMQATIAFKPGEVRVVSRSTQGGGGYAVSDFVGRNNTATLEVGKYRLQVPRGAVKKPTRFMMVVLENDIIGVRLYAWDRDWQPVRTFSTPLALTLPYDEADEAEIVAGAKLRIANLVSESDPTVLELVAAEPDRINKTVTGRLSHFSVWSLVIQFTKELSPGID